MDCSRRATIARPALFSAARLDFGAQFKSTATPAQDFSRALFIPQHYESNYAYPLVVWLHGDGQDERQLMEMIEHLSLQNFLVVSPRGISAERNGWSWPESPEEVERGEDRIFAGIDAVRRAYHVHPQRIFLAGADRGGTLALRIAMSFPERFAGAASFGGPLPNARNTPLSRLTQIRNLPVFIGVGGMDRGYSPDRAQQDLRLLLAAGVWSISLREYHPCEHPLVPPALADLNRWLMEHLGASVCASPRADQPSWSLPE